MNFLFSLQRIQIKKNIHIYFFLFWGSWEGGTTASDIFFYKESKSKKKKKNFFGLGVWEGGC